MKRNNFKKPHDAEGRTIINMSVNNDSDFLSSYSEKDVPVINGEVAEFLEQATVSTLPKNGYVLKIHSDCIDDQEKVVYEKAVREYYSERCVACKEEIKSKCVISAILAIIGVLILSIAIILEYNNYVFWTRIIDIAAWVFVWEAIDVWALRCREIRFKVKKYQAFTNMKIEFIDKK